MREGRRSSASAVCALALLLGCAGTSAAPPPGAEVPFAGVVETSGLIGGQRRFSAGTQGVWFRLEGEPGIKYQYFVTSLEAAEAAGALVRDPDAGVRFADLSGRRLEGVARVRSELAREVIALRPVEARAR